MKKYSERNKRLKKRKGTKESWLSDLDQEYIGFITCYIIESSHMYHFDHFHSMVEGEEKTSHCFQNSIEKICKKYQL